MVFPWCQEEELTSGTGLHTMATRFSKVGKSVFLKDNERQPLIERSTHNGFLTRRDGWRHENSPFAGGMKALHDFRLYLGLRQPSRALHLYLHGTVKQESVTDGRKLLRAYCEVSLYTEEVRMLVLHQQSARVVVEVVYPALQLAFAQQYLIVKATGKKESASAVFLWAGQG